MPSTIAEYMSPAALTVNESTSCDEAHALMRRHRVRHLPVMRDARPVGVISLHGIHFSLANHHEPRRTPVCDAMEPAPIVDASTNVAIVARKMIEEKLGAVLVAGPGGSLGIFTTIDALYVVVRWTGGRVSRRPSHVPAEPATH